MDTLLKLVLIKQLLHLKLREASDSEYDAVKQIYNQVRGNKQ